MLEPFQIGFKLWIKGPNNFTLGPGDIKLIKNLVETKNLTKAASECNYSYKYAWSKLRNITKKTGKAVVESRKGGKGGSGTTIITPWGLHLISTFEEIEKKFNKLIDKMNISLATKNFDGKILTKKN